ncbi:MAG: (d)CMP kinase [Ignavibacteriaceae bacterium]
MSKNLIIAIDGPAGSGKSTTAKIVAQKLDFLYIDTGAMYRAMTYLALRNNILDDEKKVVELADRCEIELNFINGVTQVKVNGENLTDYIRTIDVNKNVSKISKIEGLRKILVKKQREMATKGNGVVMEGRDIGTVVFPDADVKVFLTAIIDERARRRAKEYAENGKHVPLNEIKSNLQYRDITDSNREASPLIKAEDAVLVDTSDVSIEEQVEMILDEVQNTANKLRIEININ